MRARHFFLPDVVPFYFSEMPGQKHSLPCRTPIRPGRSDAIPAWQTYYRAFLAGAALPQFSWTLEPMA